MKNFQTDIPNLKISSSSQKIVDADEKVQKVSPPHRKSSRDEKSEKLGNWLKKESSASDLSSTNTKIYGASNYNPYNVGSRQSEHEPVADGNITAILEEEEALIAAHRKEIEDTIEIVREEMKLLAEVDRPGSQIDNYVTQLRFVLSRKERARDSQPETDTSIEYVSKIPAAFVSESSYFYVHISMI